MCWCVLWERMQSLWVWGSKCTKGAVLQVLFWMGVYVISTGSTYRSMLTSCTTLLTTMWRCVCAKTSFFCLLSAWIIRKCLNTWAQCNDMWPDLLTQHAEPQKKKKKVHQRTLLCSSQLYFALFLLRCLISWESLEPRKKKGPMTPMCVCFSTWVEELVTCRRRRSRRRRKKKKKQVDDAKLT